MQCASTLLWTSFGGCKNRLENERRNWVYQQAILLSICLFFFPWFISWFWTHDLTLHPLSWEEEVPIDQFWWWKHMIFCVLGSAIVFERERETDRQTGLLITFSPSTVFLTYAVTKVQMYIYVNFLVLCQPHNTILLFTSYRPIAQLALSPPIIMDGGWGRKFKTQWACV